MTHLQFRNISANFPKRKTKTYVVVSAHNNDQLGYVSWSGMWRQYVFHPDRDCIWSHDCLSELSQFIKDLMVARRAK